MQYVYNKRHLESTEKATADYSIEQKYKKYQNFLSDFFFNFFVVKFSVYLKRHVFVMISKIQTSKMTVFYFVREKVTGCYIFL